MNTIEKLRNLFLYLDIVKSLDCKIVRNMKNYEKVYAKLNSKFNENGEIVIKNDDDMYNEMFKAYNKIKKNRDKLELIMGNAVISWRFHEEDIFRPLIVTNLNLKANESTGSFIIKPCDNNFKFEMDMLKELPIESMNEIEKIRTKIIHTFNGENIENVETELNRLCNLLYDKNKANNCIIKENVNFNSIRCKDHPMVYCHPIILLRKKSNYIWKNEYKRAMELVQKGIEIPPTLKVILGEKIKEEKELKSYVWDNMDYTLFPLQSNKEQREVLNKLERSYGVVVQGPPGTGKSQTIANLICHLAAYGKRVLVTSETDKALKVLNDKIPHGIRDLSLCLLENDSGNLKNIEKTITKITNSLVMDEKELKRDIEKLQDELVKLKNNNYREISYEEEKWVEENKNNFNWIPDHINNKQKQPLTERQFNKLLKLLDKIDKVTIQRITIIKNKIDMLPSLEEITGKIYLLNNLEDEIKKYGDYYEKWFLPKQNDYDLDNAIMFIEKTENIINTIINSPLNKIFQNYDGEVMRPCLEKLLKDGYRLINEISASNVKLLEHKVELPQGINIDLFINDFSKLKEHLQEKGYVSKSYKLFHKKYKYIFEGCIVDYEPINSKEQVEVIEEYIKSYNSKRKLKHMWNELSNDYDIEFINEDICLSESMLKLINIIVNWDRDYVGKIDNILKGITVAENMNWRSVETYEYLKRGLEGLKMLSQYKEIKAYIISIRNLIINMRALDGLVSAIENKDIEKITEEFNKIEILKKNIPCVKEINLSLGALNSCCPKLVEQITSLIGKERLSEKYKNWNEAWKWRTLSNAIEISRNIDIKERKIINELVEKMAWHNEIMTVDDGKKRSLFACIEVTKKIGKGTGKLAQTYMRMAQKEMQNCKSAIPVWMMPINKVVENIKIADDMFDVIIVDESSQCDISALSMLLRGRKAVIVGDDNQITPECIGKDREEVQLLIKKYLKDIPHAEWLDLQTSLYNIALRTFNDRILLKEHFRSVPEIIQFSNEVCYDNEIIPMRKIEDIERFQMPIKSIKVKDGIRNVIKPVNVKEAEELVNKIQECCNDKRYKNMTIGVISLLGEAQAELIENMLIAKIGQTEMIKRKIICGDAYSFQGDERDIIFISMVIANNVKFSTLSKESDIRRFNVAVSRARNQLWIFHSVDIGDLSDLCIRKRLLQYSERFSNVVSPEFDRKFKFVRVVDNIV